MSVLEVKDLSKNFGGLRALNDMKMTIEDGQIVALIGPNGAGKTTFFNCVTGIYVPTEGDVFFTPHGADKPVRVNEMKPNKVTELGMSRTFQNIRLFPNMSVLENIMIARHCRTKTGIVGALLRTPAARREEQEIVDKSYSLLQSVGLEQYYEELACNLPYGAQRKLEIARALATEPRLLLLDEPAAGMNPHETAELVELILNIREKFNLSILLIEHDMGLVMKLSEHIYVMEYGCLIAEGTPEEIRHNPRVIKAYLGEDDNA